MVRVGFSEVTFKLKRRRKHSVVEEVHPKERGLTAWFCSGKKRLVWANKG